MLWLVLSARPMAAQDLSPRAYVRTPVNATVLTLGFAYSNGAVVTDPSVPLEDLQATVEVPSVSIVRTFSLFGRTAQALAVLPYAWAQASALVQGVPDSVTRSGFGDTQYRLSVLLHGGRAVRLADFAKARRRTVLGTSLTVSAPTGEYFPDKLINLGTSRWAFKPELAVSVPVGPRWLVDLYAGAWLFTTNDAFYPGTSVRSQEPLGTIQGHLSFNLGLARWAAFDWTYFAGGRTTVNGVQMDDRQWNSRVGATLVLPVGRRHALKLAGSTGAVIRSGADFTTLSIALITTWVGR
jgi:hypothetical protein